jgi:hypothetical protein
MIIGSGKVFIVFLILMLSIKDFTYSQDFYASYKKYEMSRVKTDNLPKKKLTRESIKNKLKDIHLTINEYNKRNSCSIFNRDTLFMISLLDERFYEIIWNGKKSCYYIDNMRTNKNGKVSFRKFEVHSNASKILKKIPFTVRQWIVKADTNSFKTQASDILNCPFISFTRAVKKENKWTFTLATSAQIDL